MNFCFANEIKIKTFEKLNSMKKQEARTFDVVGFSQNNNIENKTIVKRIPCKLKLILFWMNDTPDRFDALIIIEISATGDKNLFKLIYKTFT